MNKQIIALLLGVILFSPLTALGAGTASVNFSPQIGNYNVGKTFQVNVNIDPKGQALDTARIEIKYPSDLLEIKSFDFGPSFTIPSGENAFDNSTGIFTYGAGIPEGTNQPALFGTITFSAKSAGSAAISLSPESLVLSAGENIFDGALAIASYNVKTPVVPPKTQAPPAAVKKAVQPTEQPVAQPQEPSNLTGLEAGIVPVVTETLQKTNPSQLALIQEFISSNALAILGVILLLLIILGAFIVRKNYPSKKNIIKTS